MADKASGTEEKNPEEAERLDAQSRFLRACFHGHLIHPSIPRDGLHAIADIGTGTGIWMEEAQRELATTTTTTGPNMHFTGFDISGALFPRQPRPGQTFVVHDATHPFPDAYRERFDLVHVRFVGGGLNAPQLAELVEWVVEILRECGTPLISVQPGTHLQTVGPGGYLQWQEADALDAWTVPETATAKQTIRWLVEERVAHGLPPA